MNRRVRRLPTGRRSANHVADAPALLVSGLSATYDGRTALDGVDFRLDAGEQLAVVGPNGAGKSTLLKVIAGMLPHVGGRVEIRGHAPCRHMCIAYVPQKQEIDWRFPVTVHDVVMMGRIGRIGPLRRAHVADRRVVRDALESVDLLDLASRQIAELSGGQQQRMFLARALAQEAELVLLDEPLAGLDVHSRQDVLDRVARLRDDRIAAPWRFTISASRRRRSIGFCS